MRLLLHSGDATYNDTTKTYTFSLDRRINRPKLLRVVKAHYANAVGAVHPLVVYVESDALASLINKKHTLKLKDDGHEHGTSIICTLSETHTAGRYDLQQDVRTFETDPDKHIREIDIRFSNNGVAISKTASSGSNVTGSDAEVLAIGDDLLAFIDFAPSRTLNQAFAPVDQAGQTVYYLYNRGNNTELIFQNAYGNGTQLAAFGSHLGITQQGSWESLLDSWPVDLNDVEPTFCIHSLFKLTNLNFTYLFDIGYIKCLIWNQTLSFYDINNNKVSALAIIPHVDYLLTVRRIDGANAASLEWRLERLDDNTVSTATTVAGLTGPPNANGFPYRLGHASTHFTHVQSSLILHNGIDATHQETCQTWLRNAHAGTAGNAQETTTAEAEWFLSLDIKTE